MNADVDNNYKDNKASDVINSEAMLEGLDKLACDMAAVFEAIGKHIYGQDNVIEETMVTLLAGGHLLLIGVPGLGKTKLVETLGTVLGMDSRRVQFTPDLMPGDILGSEVLEGFFSAFVLPRSIAFWCDSRKRKKTFPACHSDI